MLQSTLWMAVLLGMSTAYLYDAKGGYCCNPPKTFEEKIERILDFNDNDGDGVMTPKDLDRDLILYDINGDCQVSAYEWVSVWSCRYGDSPDKAYDIFTIIGGGAPTISYESTFRATATNSSRADFAGLVRSFYNEVPQSDGSQTQGR